MRLKIHLHSENLFRIPYNYLHELQAVIYKIISQSEVEFASFLHNLGYNNKVLLTNEITSKKIFKLFTYSRLFFDNHKQNKSKYGFEGLDSTCFYFSTYVDRIYENFVIGLFSGKEINLYFPKNKVTLFIENAVVQEEIEISKKMSFTCYSPISVSTQIDIDGKLKKHFLDYMNPSEREHFKQNIYKNLCNKYETIFEKKWDQPEEFSFYFDEKYIEKRKGNISKLISFKEGEKIKGFEAPFVVETYPELIKIGYYCGFGENNSAGFGCVGSNTKRNELVIADSIRNLEQETRYMR
jgi:CRISPR-associated endoribonuclease Cas6